MLVAPPLATIVRSQVERRLLPLVVRADGGIPTRRLGSILWPDRLDPAASVIYSIGVGEEIEVERRLLELGARRLWLFDPTPRSVRFMASIGDHDGRLCFSPVGAWRQDALLDFHAPADPRHVSHTVLGPQGGDGGFRAEVRTLASLMRERGHEQLDVLKMNVEGAEDAILERAFADGITPGAIICTWEGRWSLAKAARWTRDLRRRGYRLAGRVDWYFTYVPRPLDRGREGLTEAPRGRGTRRATSRGGPACRGGSSRGRAAAPRTGRSRARR
ncbi:MAG: hypothetical protein FJ257_06445 [Phycisphaerae bacterium]|nr:hypothetical protein [Phycisphaerae bacterium]